MVTIGDDTLPGTITTMESAASTGANIGAPGTPVLIGQAYLSGPNATADANTAYRVTRPKRARGLFGDAENSMLTKNIQDALVEGAYPVYAIAPRESSITGEDLSGVSGQSTTLANAPIIENADDITFTINSTTKDTVLYYDGDPANAVPGTDEVLVNPQSGKAYADESMGNTGDSVDYTYADYTNTYDEVTNATTQDDVKLRQIADFLALIDENDTQVGNVQTKSDDMESNGWFNIALGGAGEPYIEDQQTATDDIGAYSDSYDTSRLQLIYPTRDPDGDSLMGAYAGKRAAIGIDASPLFKRLQTFTDLNINLSEQQKKDLVTANVNPLDETRTTIKIVEDLTTVTDSNTEESAWQRGFGRLVTDFAAEQIEDISNNYIGEFNNQGVQNTIRGNTQSALASLMQSNAIEAYNFTVEEVDSVTLAVDVGINTSDVLRNIETTISAGDVNNGVTATSN